MNLYGKKFKIKLLKLLKKLNKTTTKVSFLVRIIAVKIYGGHLVKYLIITKLSTIKSTISLTVTGK